MYLVFLLIILYPFTKIPTSATALKLAYKYGVCLIAIEKCEDLSQLFVGGAILSSQP